MTAGTQPFQIKLTSLLIWGLGLFWMLAMLSADFRDPTFFNPLYPAEGLHNWLSLSGALLGGSMIEICVSIYRTQREKTQIKQWDFPIPPVPANIPFQCYIHISVYLWPGYSAP